MSNLFIPFIVLFIIIYGTYKKVAIYDVFLIGVKDGLDLAIRIYQLKKLTTITTLQR